MRRHNAWWLMAYGVATMAHADCPDVNRQMMAAALGAPDLVLMMSIEAASCNELLLDTSQVGFRLSVNTAPINNGIRSELAVDYPFREGDTVRYSWEVKFADDFVSDAPLNRWWLTGQWHDQPDRRIGEKWVGFPAHSPSVALYIEERSGKLGMGLITNGQVKRSWTEVNRGVWIPVSMTMHWSTGADGWTELEIGGPSGALIRTPGSNMWNTYQHYLKIGQYRHSSITAWSTVYYRTLRIAKVSSTPPSASRKSRPTSGK